MRGRLSNLLDPKVMVLLNLSNRHAFELTSYIMTAASPIRNRLFMTLRTLHEVPGQALE